MYKVRISSRAQKKLSKIPDSYYSSIKFAIIDLAKNPRPHGFKNSTVEMVTESALQIIASYTR